MLGPFIAAAFAAGATSVLAAPSFPAVLQNYTSSAGTKWAYSNCQSDLAYGTRALPIGLSTANRTVEACLESCTKAGYKLCGVEYHGECWGGDALDKTSTAQAESSCELTCWDNPLQICGGTGGDSRATMNLYKRASTATTPVVPVNNSTNTTKPSPAPTGPVKFTADSNWAYKGCYTDLVNNARSLPNALSAGNWSASACLTAAKAAGYSVAGVTYGGECWAGNSLSSAAAKKVDATCDWSCNDARGFTCGGDKLLDVYTSTSAPLPTPATNQTIYVNWKYDDCYSDRPDLRSLPISLDNPKGTIEGCLAACSAVNATLCGLEWYGECFASTSGFQHLAAPVDQSQCSTPCRSNSAQICGGNNALSVYKPYTPPPPPLTVLDKYKYTSCDNGLPGPVIASGDSTFTIEKCLEACDAQNAPACSYFPTPGAAYCIVPSGAPLVRYPGSSPSSCFWLSTYTRLAGLKRRTLSLNARATTVATVNPDAGTVTFTTV